MTSRMLSAAAAAAAVLVLALIITTRGGGDDYAVKIELSDALGLRNGSKVVVGGVTVGRVHLSLGADDKVNARITVAEKYAPIGKDASAAVTSVNLLGEKSLQLDPGNRRDPAPDGSTLAAAKVTPSTDLDQVLDVLDTGTRTRLTILINAAGQAFTGRRADFAGVLRTLPAGLKDGTDLLQRVDADHRTLADLVARSDRFVATLTANRGALADTLGTFGRAAETAETRRPELRQTLRELPGTLQTAQRFLNDLRSTALPLGPAARELSAVAGPLDRTLAEIGPFTKAAAPTLDKAVAVSPSLTRLADGATPVLRRAVPTLRTLASFSRSLEPISAMLDNSAANIVGVASNWAHAIQGRDALSHVFRAEVAVTPQTVKELVDRLLAAKSPERTGSSRPSAGERAPGAVTDAVKKALPPTKRVLDPVKKHTDPVGKTVVDVLNRLGVPTAGDAQPSGGNGRSGGSSLLDFLLKP
jgi:phospholipid/cholesterol/gamma-HCH transport system substrate-binding protein